MPILSILVVLIVLGLVLYLINMIPMDATIKSIVHAVAIALVCLWLISLLVPQFGHFVLR